jgi:T-complex protein 1 subunit theta
VCKVLGAGVAASRLMNGMVFRRGAEGEVKEVTGAKVAVFACPFDLTQTETKVVRVFGVPLMLASD